MRHRVILIDNLPRHDPVVYELELIALSNTRGLYADFILNPGECEVEDGIKIGLGLENHEEPSLLEDCDDVAVLVLCDGHAAGDVVF